MADPRRLFEAKDAEAAALYAKRLATSEDVYPVLVDAAGNLCINMTAGSLSLGGTVNTIAFSSLSTSNTTTTPLSSSATFTGGGEVNNYPQVMVSVFTDNASTLFFDFSNDGTNWNTFPTNGFAIAASTHELHVAEKGPRYFRVRLVNGSGAQSVLRLYTYFGHFQKLNAPLNQAITNDADAQIVRAVIAGETTAGGGSFVNVKVNPSGTLETNATLSSTLVTTHLSPSASVATVHFSRSASVTTAHISPSASVVTVHISPSASAVTAALSNTNVTVNIGRVLTGCTVSISATTGTVTTAGTNRLKIYAVSVTTTATTSSVITFVNGTYGGMVLWRAVLQAPSGANAGLNLAVTPPAYLFATSSATLLRANLSASIPIEVAVSYFDEA